MKSREHRRLQSQELLNDYAVEALIAITSKAKCGTAGAVRSKCLATIYDEQLTTTPTLGVRVRNPRSLHILTSLKCIIVTL